MLRLLLVSVILFSPSHFLLASLSISEIAWMGSSESANHEWIELFNQGADVSVEGWTLSDNNNLNIELSGVISSNSYAVLERNRSDGGSVVGVPFLNYSGALVNTGAVLTLRDDQGGVVDQVAGGDNWENIGGDNTTKDTAQYTADGWVTALATPGQPNASVSSNNESTVTSQSSTSPNIISVSVTPDSSAFTNPTKPLSLQIKKPQFIYAGQEVTFGAVPQGMTPTIRNSLQYRWNFGDLHTSTSVSPAHTFKYPGTYNVFLEGKFADKTVSTRIEVSVLPITVSLSYSPKGDVLLHNNAMYEVDISGYYLSGTKVKQIPAHTYISPRETITIPWQMLTRSSFPATVLLDANKIVLTSLTKQPSQTATENSLPQASAYPSITANDTEVIIEPKPSESKTPAFGFSSTVSDQVSEQPDSLSQVDLVDQKTGDAYGVTPILTATTSHTPPATTWWVYISFIVLLFLAVGGLLYKPTKKQSSFTID